MDVDDSSEDLLVPYISKTENISAATIKANIVSGEFKVINKSRGKSKVWEIFGVIENSWGEIITGMVYCRGCSSVYRYHHRTTSNLARHKCAVSKMKNEPAAPKTVLDSIEVKKNVVRVVTKWIVDNCRCFEIIEDSGIKSFAELLLSIGAKHGENVDIESLLPQATTISKNVEQLYGTSFAEIKDEINLIKDLGYGLTLALWTDNYLRITYILLTIHYIEGEQLIHKLLGIKSADGKKPTAENIEQKVRELLNNFNCEFDDKVTIVTERGTVMDAGFRSCNHIYCINHLLHDAVEKSMKEIPRIANLYRMCAELVQYLLELGIDSTLETTLKSFTFKRWNTTYYLFDAILKNWDEITNILEDKNEHQRIKNINLNYITGLVQLLQLFNDTSRTLEAVNKVTLHLVYVHIHRLKKNCVIKSWDPEIVKNLKEKLNSFLESQVLPNITVYHKMALFLFPPANKLIPFSESDKILVKDECKRIMISYLGEISDEVKVDNKSASTSRLSSNNADLFNDFVQSVEIQSTFSEDRVNSEIIMYQSTNVTFYDDFDLLKWWHLHKGEFPLLYKLSCYILATPASSAVSESSIEAAKSLIAENSVESNSINQIMFLHSNRRNDISIEFEREFLNT